MFVCVVCASVGEDDQVECLKVWRRGETECKGPLAFCEPVCD